MSSPSRFRSFVQVLVAAGFLFVGLFFFLLPGLTAVRTVFFDAGLRSPGGSAFAFRLHRSLSKDYVDYARERLASGAAKELTLAQIAETEWPLFGATFYLWATEALQDSWSADPAASGPAPKEYAREAIEGATALVIDPGQAAWVKKHWGETEYLTRENVFYRMLVISSLTAHHRLTGSEEHLGFLREQVTTLAVEIEASPHGLLDDYPGQCFPSDVVGAIAAILHADSVLGTDHRAFADRAIRGFSGACVTAVGLPPYAADSRSGQPLDAARGCSNAHLLTFAPQVWPGNSKAWFDLAEIHFWQRNWFLAGFREFPKSAGNNYYADVDSGPVMGGFGMSASSFGTGAARANGRFDLAYPLAAELFAASWPLPNGTLLMPRLFSNGAHAPLLGESAIVFQLSREPASGDIVEPDGRSVPGFVWLLLAFYFGLGYFITKRAAGSLFRAVKAATSVARNSQSMSEARISQPVRSIQHISTSSRGEAKLTLGLMRGEATSESIERFIRLLGTRAKGPGRVYLVGGTTAVLHGWRRSTIDIDLKLDPEPPGIFEAIALLKDELALNVELAAPDDFLPELPGWRDRSPWIARHGAVDFHHYDLYSQALSKLERGHPRDLDDVASMRRAGLVDSVRLRELFNAIVPQLIRFPAIDAAGLASAVENLGIDERPSTS